MGMLMILLLAVVVLGVVGILVVAIAVQRSQRPGRLRGIVKGYDEGPRGRERSSAGL